MFCVFVFQKASGAHIIHETKENDKLQNYM
jgi:hypothetical protein